MDCLPSTSARAPPLRPARRGVRCAQRGAVRPPRAPTAASAAAGAAPPPAPLDDGPTRALLAWAKGAGLDTGAVAPASFAGLRGLATTAAVKEGDTVAAVPRAAALVLGPTAKCPFPDFVPPDAWAAAPWYGKLALRLVHERRAGAGSPLAAYIASLPAAVDVPATWSEAELAALQYPHLQELARAQRREWEALHGRLAAAAPGARLTLEELAWGIALVRSRTFSGPFIGSTLADRARTLALVVLLGGGSLATGTADAQAVLSAAISVFVFNILYELVLSRSLKQYAMCPFLDLANHRGSEGSEVAYDYFRDRYAVAAARDVPAGEQFYVSYGPQSNDRRGGPPAGLPALSLTPPARPPLGPIAAHRLCS